MNIEEREQITRTILGQLGGNKFVTITGAHSMTTDIDGSLGFKFRGSKNFQHLKITLNDLDLYDLTFSKIGRAPTFKIKQKKINNIYFDTLQGIFTQETGLDTHL